MSKCSPHIRASLALSSELRSLRDEPVEGFKVDLLNESDLFHWNVAIFGPPETLYAGGYFKAVMTFPSDYPFAPPQVKFVNKLWHPNIYVSGEVCISILHFPTNNIQAGELPQERWNPTQNVRSVLMSIISMLSEPNTSSPANIDASLMYRRWKETKGRDNEYVQMIEQNVQDGKKDADKDGVEIPLTMEEYLSYNKSANLENKKKIAENKQADEEFMDRFNNLCVNTNLY